MCEFVTTMKKVSDDCAQKQNVLQWHVLYFSEFLLIFDNYIK